MMHPGCGACAGTRCRDPLLFAALGDAFEVTPVSSGRAARVLIARGVVAGSGTARSPSGLNTVTPLLLQLRSHKSQHRGTLELI